jgi:hypothetical protein
MQPEQILTLGRVIERLIVCAFAGASLACGWNLFRVGVVNPHPPFSNYEVGMQT